MKQRTKWLAGALAAAGLIAASPAHAQFTTNIISSFNSITATALYASWGSGIITSTPGGFEVNATGYGSGAFAPDGGGPVNDAGATEVQLTFTINTPNNGDNFMGPNFDLTDGTHQVQYLEYAHYITPGTFTVTAALNGIDPTDIVAFNLEMDPAGYGSFNPYDITYNQIALLTPTATPEPATFALIGLGAAGLLAFRRRK
jgi:PEP-CTERM motif